MPKKKTETEYLTQPYFDSYMSDFRKEFLTKTEFKLYMADFRKEVITTKEFNSYMVGFRAEIDSRFDTVDSHFNDVMTTLDKLVKMYEDRKIEDMAALNQSRRQDERLENHEQRLTGLEAKIS